MTEFKELAGCIIVEGGELLLLSESDTGLWNVPGGEVNEDESPTSAAIRETESILGVEPELEKPLFTGEFQHEGELFLWHGYIGVVSKSPELADDRFSDLQWFSAADLTEVDMAPNLEMIKPGLMRMLK